MEEIYNILSKHFSGTTSAEEEKQAVRFQKENPKEYLALFKLWKSEGIEVKDYNAWEALEKVKSQQTSFSGISSENQAKVRSLYPNLLKKVASLAAIFLLVIGAGLVFYQVVGPQKNDLITATTTPSKSNQKIELADGSMVYLNKNSKLIYPTQFEGGKREVQLEGEAFFEIAKDASKPFVITTHHNEVKVLGTSFNISTDVKETEVTVATGQVKVSSLTNNESALLVKNKRSVSDANGLQVSSVDNKNYLAWKTGEFSFKEQAIEEVVSELNTYYSDQIILSNPQSPCVLTSSFNKDDLEDVLKVIQLSCNLNVKNKNTKYELY